MGDLGATYDDHLRLIGKRVVDFLLVLIELFSLGVTVLCSDVTIHAFDRRTDGRKDRILIARPRLHSMQCGKNQQFGNLRGRGAQCTHTPNFNAVEQSDAELLRFTHVKFGHRPPSWI